MTITAFQNNGYLTLFLTRLNAIFKVYNSCNIHRRVYKSSKHTYNQLHPVADILCQVLVRLSDTTGKSSTCQVLLRLKTYVETFYSLMLPITRLFIA
jgi:hypothetical protein